MKMITKTAFLLLCLVPILLLSNSALATNTAEDVEAHEGITATDELFLQINPVREDNCVLIQIPNRTGNETTKETENFGGFVFRNESLEAYNNTDLSDYTTEELVAFILNNHRSMSTMLHFSYDNPYEEAKVYYHGLEELELREDAMDVLKRAYNALKNAEVETQEQAAVYSMRVRFLELVLSVDMYQPECDRDNKLNTAMNRSSNLEGMYGYAYNNAGTVQTRGGNSVNIYSPVSDYYEYEKVDIRNDLCSAFQGAVYLGEATRKYNGYSYAWYLSNTTNQYCIFDIDPYLTDAHTVELTTIQWQDCMVGDIIVYQTADNKPRHAGVVTSNNNGQVYITSKWDTNCLFRHFVGDIPDDFYVDPDTQQFSLRVYRVSNHRYSVISYSAAGHTCECIDCGYRYNEPHVMSMLNVCRVCGYSGPTVID